MFVIYVCTELHISTRSLCTAITTDKKAKPRKFSVHSFIHFISHSINPIHGVNHKDVESVIEHNNIYNIQQYSWIMCKSKDLHV
jgi:hypothetical protein